MAKKSPPRSKPAKARKSPGKLRSNTGRDSEGAATGAIIRTLPQSASGSMDHPVSGKSKFLKRLIIGIVLLIVVGFIYLFYKGRRSVVSETGTVKIEGLVSGATIARDELGVAFVKADNEQDAFFGAGYAAATDRLWQMYSTKLAVTGRLAEIAGEVGRAETCQRRDDGSEIGTIEDFGGVAAGIFGCEFAA